MESDEFDDEVVEVVGEATDDHQETIGNVMRATIAIMRKYPGSMYGVWGRADGRAEIVPHWVVSERKRRQKEDTHA